MPHKDRILKRAFITVLLIAAVSVAAGIAYAKFWELPPLSEPYEYGGILISRTTEGTDVKPVYFSHWTHRLKYTCRVCHYELGFEFKKNTTDITEVDNQNGLFCGACHNDRDAFGHSSPLECKYCHTGKLAPDTEYFKRIWHRLPPAEYGNRIDWTKAVKITKPAYSIFKNEKPMQFNKKLTLEGEWSMTPPAIFPHDAHVAWLDCSNCHPDIFNIKKKSTKHFLMQYILEEKFCGVCHLKVAFPLDHCERCHPGIKEEK